MSRIFLTWNCYKPKGLIPICQYRSVSKVQNNGIKISDHENLKSWTRLQCSMKTTELTDVLLYLPCLIAKFSWLSLQHSFKVVLPFSIVGKTNFEKLFQDRFNRFKFPHTAILIKDTLKTHTNTQVQFSTSKTQVTTMLQAAHLLHLSTISFNTVSSLHSRWCTCPIWHEFKSSVTVEIGCLNFQPVKNCHFHFTVQTATSMCYFVGTNR